MAETDVSNKNTSFFAALDKVQENSSVNAPVVDNSFTQTETGEVLGNTMQVSKEAILAQALKEEEEFVSKEEKDSIVSPKIKNSCMEQSITVETLKDFINYLQDNNLITILEEFSVKAEYLQFLNKLFQNEAPEEIEDEIENVEELYSEETLHYAQQVLDNLMDIIDYTPFSIYSIKELGILYNNDYDIVFENEADNILEVMEELGIPVEQEDYVLDVVIEKIIEG